MKDNSQEIRRNEFYQELDVFLKETNDSNEHIRQSIKSLKQERKELKIDKFKEIDNIISEKHVELQKEILSMAETEEKKSQLQAQKEYYDSVIQDKFGGRTIDENILVEVQNEKILINDKIKHVTEEIEKVLEENHKESVNCELYESLIIDDQDNCFQSEIDDFRRLNADLMEEIEILEEQITDISRSSQLSFANYQEIEKNATDEIIMECSLIVSHTESIKSSLKELLFLNS